MQSFKLEKGNGSKDSASSAGALLIILGLVVAFLIHFLAGGAMIVLGIIALLAGKYAS